MTWNAGFQLPVLPQFWQIIRFTNMFLNFLKTVEHIEVSYIHGLVQGTCNSIANALELRLSCTNPSIYVYSVQCLISVWYCPLQFCGYEAGWYDSMYTVCMINGNSSGRLENSWMPCDCLHLLGILTHWCWVVHICISKLYHHWFR